MADSIREVARAVRLMVEAEVRKAHAPGECAISAAALVDSAEVVLARAIELLATEVEARVVREQRRLFLT